MIFSVRLRRLLAAAAALLAGCSTPRSTVHYVVSTESHYICCRSIHYATAEFDRLYPSSLKGAADEPVVVRLGHDSSRVSCGEPLELPVVIANNGDQDVYVPMSNELEGDRIKLFPWRWVSVGGRNVRLARQIQYTDLVETIDVTPRFFRLPAGKEVHLHGIILPEWLCSLPRSIPEDYLKKELDPKVYADYTRLLRGANLQLDTSALGHWGLQYDVVYTPLDFIEALPLKEKQWNPGHDSVNIMLGVPEEPATFLNASQKVAHSNTLTLDIER
jgi:hypothetical protein